MKSLLFYEIPFLDIVSTPLWPSSALVDGLFPNGPLGSVTRVIDSLDDLAKSDVKVYAFNLGSNIDGYFARKDETTDRLQERLIYVNPIVTYQAKLHMANAAEEIKDGKCAFLTEKKLQEFALH